MSLWQKTKHKFQEHIVKPIMESHSPIGEASLGAAIGMFWGMTPTIGIQMWLVWMTWVILKPFRVRFDLVIGTAMVWLSNPITMGPLYYGFLITGYWFFEFMGQTVTWLTYDSFTATLAAITNNPDAGTWDKFVLGVKYMILELGYPMIIGSLFWATPLALLSFIGTEWYLHRSRKQKAAAMGIAYEEWRKRFEYRSTEAEFALSKHEKKKKRKMFGLGGFKFRKRHRDGD